jgi:phospholipase C
LATPSVASLGSYEHIIVVIQENRSFDNMFAGAGISGADVATFGYNSQCSVPTNVATCGQVPLQPLSFDSSGPDHDHARLIKEWSNGLMNGFDQASLSPSVPNPQTCD